MSRKLSLLTQVGGFQHTKQKINSKLPILGTFPENKIINIVEAKTIKEIFYKEDKGWFFLNVFGTILITIN